jgi:CheY-like chemotaxis protein
MLTTAIGLGSDRLEKETSVQAQVQSSQTPRVLLVEDEQIIRDALVPILFRAGLDCREAADGRSAIELLAGGTRINLVLSNLLLPEVDGWTLFLHVRQRYQRVPFVFMTAVRDPQVREVGMRLGAAGFLYKPFLREELLAAVAEALHCGSNPLFG